MKKIKTTIAFLVFFVAFSCSKADRQKATFSKEALAETILNTEGNQIAFNKILSQNKGKNVVIKIWATWCRDCIEEIPKMKELQAAHPETNYIYISMDDSADKWKYGIEKHQLKGAHFMAKDQMKGAFAKAIDLDWIPRYIIVDKTGKIVLYHTSENDFDRISSILTQLEKGTI